MSDLSAAFAVAASSSSSSSSAAAAAESLCEDDGAEMWTQAPFSKSSTLHCGLQAMEELLTCYCCHELMRAPMSLTSCGHVFCSHCITGYAKTTMRTMKRKLNCPTCRSEVPTKDISDSLVSNATMEELIINFRGIRSQLKEALALAARNGNTNVATASAANTDNAQSQTNGNNNSNNSNNNATTGRGRKRGRQNYAELEDDDNENYKESSDDEDGVVVLQPKDDNHQQPQKLPASQFAQHGLTSRKKKSKTSYHALKKKQLQKVCEREGLPSTGTDDDLKARHDAFVTLYNAECDSTRPRSHTALLRVVMQEESAKKRHAAKSAKDSKCMEQLLKQQRGRQTETKNGGDSTSKPAAAAATGVASSGNAAFDAKLKSNFASLTAQLRARQPKRAKSSSPADESNDDERKEEENKTTSNSTSEHASSASATTPSTNPYKKQPPSGGSTSSLLAPSFLSSNLAYHVQTPMAAPNLFQPGSNAPSTISHQASQSFALPSSQSAATDTLDRLAKAGAVSTPNNNNAGGGGAASSEEDVPAAPAAANTAATTRPKKRQAKLTLTVTRTTRASRSRQIPTPQPPPAHTRRGGRSICGPWTCSFCTLENTIHIGSTANCEMCLNPRTVAEAQPNSSSQREVTVSL